MISTHISVRQVWWLVAVGECDVKGIFKAFVSRVQVVDVTLEKIPL